MGWARRGRGLVQNVRRDIKTELDFLLWMNLSIKQMEKVFFILR
jgi:hypothetical protein